jgi:hypothetical protein
LRPRLGRLGVDVGGGCIGRSYLAALAADSTHAGRVDVIWRGRGAIRYELRPGLALVGEIEPVWRDAVSPYQQDTDEVKSYRSWSGGVGIRYGGGR